MPSESEKAPRRTLPLKASGKRLTVTLRGPEGAYAQQRLVFMTFGAEQFGLEAGFFMYMRVQLPRQPREYAARSRVLRSDGGFYVLDGIETGTLEQFAYQAACQPLPP